MYIYIMIYMHYFLPMHKSIQCQISLVLSCFNIYFTILLYSNFIGHLISKLMYFMANFYVHDAYNLGAYVHGALYVPGIVTCKHLESTRYCPLL